MSHIPGVHLLGRRLFYNALWAHCKSSQLFRFPRELCLYFIMHLDLLSVWWSRVPFFISSYPLKFGGRSVKHFLESIFSQDPRNRDSSFATRSWQVMYKGKKESACLRKHVTHSSPHTALQQTNIPLRFEAHRTWLAAWTSTQPIHSYHIHWR